MMTARMSSENVTLPLFNHFLIIPSCMACKMSTNYPGSILIGMSNLLIGKKKWKICSQILTLSTQDIPCCGKDKNKWEM